MSTAEETAKGSAEATKEPGLVSTFGEADPGSRRGVSVVPTIRWYESWIFKAAIMASFILFVGYAVSYWAAPYAERMFAVDKATLGFLIGAPAALGGFLGAIFGGRLADMLQARFAGGRIMVIAIALVCPVPIMLVGYSTANPTLFYVLAFAVQLVTSTALGASGAASQALVLPRMRGVATGIFFLGTALIGLGLGPFVAGFVSEASGSLATGVKATLLIEPLGLIAMIVAIRAAPKAAATLLDRARAAGEPV